MKNALRIMGFQSVQLRMRAALRRLTPGEHIDGPFEKAKHVLNKYFAIPCHSLLSWRTSFLSDVLSAAMKEDCCTEILILILSKNMISNLYCIETATAHLRY
jgi:hypothetical protein